MAAGGIGITLLTDVERCNADIAYWLGEQYWGRGIATQVLAAVSEYAFVTLDISCLQAWVFAWNKASMRVLEKCGYVREAVMRKSAIKDGQLIDRMLYARPRDP
jgi:RimJ/RimL family protein N-acetyltransferase